MLRNPINVLLIDDDEDSYYQIRSLLAESHHGHYQLSWEYSYEAATQRLRQNDQDVCLLDYRLGEYTGVDLLRVAREQGFKAPIIILTGESDPSVDLKALHAGAVDYLPKGKTDAALLEHAIRYAIAHTQTLEALRKSEERYKTLLEAVTHYWYMVKVEKGQEVYISHTPSCQAVTGYTAEEFLGAPALVRSIVHLEEQAFVQAQTRRALAGEEVPPFEYRLHHKMGPVHWVRTTLVLRHNEQGDLIGYDGLITDITERRQLEDHLRYIGQHDVLTSLHNRTFFSEAMRRLEQNGPYPISMIIADVDRLKVVNDELGHHAGDEMLRRAAVLLKRTFRSEDIVARLGGDEFGILLPATNTAAVAHKVDQIRKALYADDQPSRRIPLHISLGAATVQQGGLLSDGLSQADRLMYQDKLRRHMTNPSVLLIEDLP